MDKIDKLITLTRLIKEENGGGGSVGAGSPTNSASNLTSSSKPTIAGLPPDQPPVNLKKRKNYAKGGKDSRRWWLQFLKGK
jgi:hypothetical protein